MSLDDFSEQDAYELYTAEDRIKHQQRGCILLLVYFFIILVLMVLGVVWWLK